jgi:hypothetical protein
MVNKIIIISILLFSFFEAFNQNSDDLYFTPKKKTYYFIEESDTLNYETTIRNQMRRSKSNLNYWRWNNFGWNPYWSFTYPHWNQFNYWNPYTTYWSNVWVYRNPYFNPYWNPYYTYWNPYTPYWSWNPYRNPYYWSPYWRSSSYQSPQKVEQKTYPRNGKNPSESPRIIRSEVPNTRTINTSPRNNIDRVKTTTPIRNSYNNTRSYDKVNPGRISVTPSRSTYNTNDRLQNIRENKIPVSTPSRKLDINPNRQTVPIRTSPNRTPGNINRLMIK